MIKVEISQFFCQILGPEAYMVSQCEIKIFNPPQLPSKTPAASSINNYVKKCWDHAYTVISA